MPVVWTEMPPEPDFIGPSCPDQCKDGAQSHVWMFRWDAFDGASIHTDECPICNRGVNQTVSDWPHEYLVLDEIPVRLEAFTETYGYETLEYDHYVVMTPQQIAVGNDANNNNQKPTRSTQQP